MCVKWAVAPEKKEEVEEDETYNSLLAILFIPIIVQTETDCTHIPTTYDAFWKVL
jgi:hypothetical protein